MDAMSGWKLVEAHFKQPEYLHVLLNPLPIYGLGCGFLASCVALLFRERRAHWVALVIVFVCALSAWPVAELGEAGYDRVLAMSDDSGGKWLDEHVVRADRVLWVYYVVAGLAVISILVPMKYPDASRKWLLATTVASAIALGCGAYIGYAGGQVRHSEFRYGPAPERAPKQEHGHEH